MRWFRTLALGVMLATAPWPAAADGRADGDVAPAAGERTAVLVFVAWQELEGELLDATALRLAMADELAAALRRAGSDVVDGERLRPLVSRWRIRGGTMIHGEFLRDLRERLDVDRLLVGELFLLRDRLLLAWRSIDAATGLLADAGFDEAALALPAGAGEQEPERGAGSVRRAPPPAGSGPWLAAAGRIGHGFSVRTGPPAADGELLPLVLPVQAVGSDTGAAALAGHALVIQLCGESRGAVVDPALAASALRRSGYATDEMNPGVRRVLRERFGADAVWTGQLVSYDVSAARVELPVPEPDGPVAGDTGSMDDFALSLTRIDLADGRITASDEIFENRAVEYGWFGLQTEHSLLERLQAAVARLRSGSVHSPEGRVR